MFLLNFLTDQEREHHEYFSGAYSLSELSGFDELSVWWIGLLMILLVLLLLLAFPQY